MGTHLLRSLVLILTLIYGEIAVASNAASDLRTLHQLKLDLLDVTSLFRRYQSSEGNKKYYLAITHQLDSVKRALSETEAILARHNLTSEARTIKSNSKAYLQSLNTSLSSIKNGGFTDRSAVDTYLNTNDNMIKYLSAAYSAIASSGEYSVPPMVTKLRNQTLLMQQMHAKYIEGSSPQGYSLKSDQESSATLKQLAAKFSDNLEQLTSEIPVSSPYAARIGDVHTKWLFLEKSFLNTNERTIPFLIAKFGRQIITELTSIANDMEADT